MTYSGVEIVKVRADEHLSEPFSAVGQEAGCRGSVSSVSSEMAKAELGMSPLHYAERQFYSEEDLIAAAQRGVPSALEELLSMHRSTVYRAVYHFTGDVHDAEDLVQETMLRAVTNIGRFRKEARFSTWLVAIAVNAAISIKRREKHVHWVFLDEPMYGDDGMPLARDVPDHRLNPEQAYLDKERCTLLRRAISKQHRKFRMILRWCDLYEVPVSVVARTLGITCAAAKSRLFHARRKLSATVRKQTGM